MGLLHFWTNPSDSPSNVLSEIPVAWTSQADQPDLFFQHFQPSPVVNNGYLGKSSPFQGSIAAIAALWPKKPVTR